MKSMRGKTEVDPAGRMTTNKKREENISDHINFFLTEYFQILWRGYNSGFTIVHYLNWTLIELIHERDY